MLNQKKELYNQKKKIKRNNKIIKGLFLNDNLFIIAYKKNKTLIFEEEDFSGNCKDIKKYNCKLFDYNYNFGIIKLNSTYLLLSDDHYIYFFNYELKQIETILQLEPNSQSIFSRINKNLIFIKDNIININKLNLETLELEKIKEINIPNAFKNINKNIYCVYLANKFIYSISCVVYNESDDDFKNISKLFIID